MNEVVQVACGPEHTIALTESELRVAQNNSPYLANGNGLCAICIRILPLRYVVSGVLIIALEA